MSSQRATRRALGGHTLLHDRAHLRSFAAVTLQTVAHQLLGPRLLLGAVHGNGPALFRPGANCAEARC
eukprot:8322612-Lingulodinium_polyedra.AAC.1